MPYPTLNNLTTRHFGKKFLFPIAFVQEMQRKFPKWKALLQAIKNGEQDNMWELFNAYLNRLSEITPEAVVKASQTEGLPDLVLQAMVAVEFKEFLNDIEQRYFPERIQARKDAERRVLLSYET